MDSSPAFNVVIAYEDFETGKRAMKTYDYLVQHLGDECMFRNQMWKFDVLTVGKLREMAVKDAAAADIIIVSAHGNDALPDPVKAWIESWLMEERSAIALVGLFDAGGFMETPVCNYLAEAARRGNMEFFAQPGLWPGKNQGRLTTESWERSRAFSLLASAVQDDTAISHWGINE